MNLTPNQQQTWDVYQRLDGNVSAAARELNISRSSMQDRLRVIRRKAELTDSQPGYTVTGRSTLYDADGEKKIEWVKTSKEKEDIQKALQEAVEAMKEELPKEKPTKLKNKTHDDDLVNCYIITDYHLGMYSWPDETGEDWNTEIAENTLVRWFQAAIEQSPKAEKAILANIGDFLHWDGLEAVTPTNRHVLDADTRFRLIVRVAIRVFKRVIRMLLEKYKSVHVIMADANHDPASEIWLAELFFSMYENEPRITVDTNADSYYCYEHGLTSLFFHHGHKRRVSNIDDVCAAKYREIFGRTKFSYAHMGHLHHIEVKETNLMVVNQHRTLAAKDAYASRGGYMSGRSSDCLTYSKTYGEVGRVTISYDRVADEAIRE